MRNALGRGTRDEERAGHAQRTRVLSAQCSVRSRHLTARARLAPSLDPHLPIPVSTLLDSSILNSTLYTYTLAAIHLQASPSTVCCWPAPAPAALVLLYWFPRRRDSLPESRLPGDERRARRRSPSNPPAPDHIPRPNLQHSRLRGPNYPVPTHSQHPNPCRSRTFRSSNSYIVGCLSTTASTPHRVCLRRALEPLAQHSSHCHSSPSQLPHRHGGRPASLPLPGVIRVATHLVDKFPRRAATAILPEQPLQLDRRRYRSDLAHLLRRQLSDPLG